MRLRTSEIVKFDNRERRGEYQINKKYIQYTTDLLTVPSSRTFDALHSVIRIGNRRIRFANKSWVTFISEIRFATKNTFLKFKHL